MLTNISNEIKKIIDENLTEVLFLRDDFELKNDGSYVSKGDLLISKLLKEFFKKRFCDHIYVSEEDYDETHVWDENGSYVFVDPIDGTENFVSGLKEWGVGISIYTSGLHSFSFIYLPELHDIHYTGKSTKSFKSRVNGLSSSLTVNDLISSNSLNSEIRIIGCAMYNLLSAARGSFKTFENVRGVNCWDILPGLNLAIELNKSTFVDGKKYRGEILFPTKKYKVYVGDKCE